MARGNLQTQQLANIDSESCGEVVRCLRDLAKYGEPKTTEELKQRIDSYFEFCADNNIRIGIESLCLSLGINRQKFWRWCNGNDLKIDREWQDVCVVAKQYCASFIEMLTLNGKLNPASSIFYLKNWFNYKDTVNFETENTERRITASELPIFTENGIVKPNESKTRVISAKELPVFNEK